MAGQPAASRLTLLGAKAGEASVTVVGDQEFVALDDLATTFQLTARRKPAAVTVSYRGRNILSTPNQTLASVARRLVSLPAPLTRSGNRWLVPVEFISRALRSIYETRLDLRRPSRLLVVGDLARAAHHRPSKIRCARRGSPSMSTPRAHNAITQESRAPHRASSTPTQST